MRFLPPHPSRFAWPLAGAIALAGCGETAKLPAQAGVGADPQLPQPTKTLIPTVNVAEAVGWPPGAKPVAAQGTQVAAFASGLDHPRWLEVLPNGDVLVAESNAPAKEARDGGMKAFFMKLFMKKAGAGVHSPDRIVLLRDADGDGVAEVKSTYIEHLYSPFGMALVGNDLYVANADAVLRFPYDPSATRIEQRGEKVVDLPGPPINHHWTKNIVASRDGSRLYATVGSNSNVAENGMQAEDGRAAIWEIDPKTRMRRLYASGLRNPNGLDFEPRTGALWTVVNERDELGSDLVPDYLTSVKAGGFYGWPYSYFGQHVDERVQPQKPELVLNAIVPDYALGTHVAPLGLAFNTASALPPPFTQGAFIGQHGSWNREPRNGYNVVFVPFQDGRPVGKPIDLLTGFVSPDGKAWGRPVGVALDRSGALLVADDVGNTVWRVSAAGNAANAPQPVATSATSPPSPSGATTDRTPSSGR